mmetsp:Transcript_76074/g.150761  ORF Transcript_76074/g.150761 Transcript_76074/m.150761 type:complete len:85 (-) Transcript_76074:70-324(-)|eukprot:CAMPEP_0174694596 /NCGR_PEP_ID=MMETSP1094-20130205/1153_1 /TAXON_ID=156173 /ORGANISM="Chrysochromulina brevifilum, Strain UTEX LB 985" /LENGTH=84 /DNA_ID=CAMNT_0015890875 /DNA_START=198 /DNA_END=452 /DNA_ORIENTATION=+
MYANACSLANAEKVAGKIVQLPEIQALKTFHMDPELGLKGRLLDNVVDFIINHLSTKSTRHAAEDQNAHNVLLTAVVGRQDDGE